MLSAVTSRLSPYPPSADKGYLKSPVVANGSPFVHQKSVRRHHGSALFHYGNHGKYLQINWISISIKCNRVQEKDGNVG
jgi:hypothetical protein